MATAESTEVTIEGKTVTVQNVAIDDAEAVEFLTMHGDEAAAELVTEALRVGLTAMRLTQTTVDVEFVERKFGEMLAEFSEEVEAATDEFGGQVEDMSEDLDDAIGEDGRLDSQLEAYLDEDGELESRLETAFAEDGPFHERLDEELGENGERIQKALNPDTEGTPTNVLRTEIKELRDHISGEQAVDSVIQSTTLKGDEFEDTVSEILEQMAYRTPNSFEFTGETFGEIPDAKVGDFVYELGGTNTRIVVEAKTEDYGFDDIQEEMRRAIENRDADYGVFVTDHLGNLPRTKVGWFHELDREFVTVALSETPDDELEPAFLRFAMNWAQVRALHDVDKASDDIDASLIQSEIDAIDDKIDRFAQIRKQCTSIEDSVEEIRGELKDIEEDVDERFVRLQGELSGAE